MKRRLFKIRRGMKLLMRLLLVVNMNLDGQELLKTHFLMVRLSTAADVYYRPKKNILDALLNQAIM
jgi:hypothetical protein